MQQQFQLSMHRVFAKITSDGNKILAVVATFEHIIITAGFVVALMPLGDEGPPNLSRACCAG
jgi:hypothetical protein